MKICPITYETIKAGATYSEKGLKLLHPKLEQLTPLPYSNNELLTQVAIRATKMSIQGVQPKLSAILYPNKGKFELVDNRGTFIFKPQTIYPELPENENVTMKLAETMGIEVPPNGLIKAADGNWVYFIKRFDRLTRGKKTAVEDFAQLLGEDRDTKYRSSVEKVVGAIKKFCTFPTLETINFFKRFIFNFLVGNEDMHLKNYALFYEKGRYCLTPAFDFLNTTIVLEGTKEESALPLQEKKSNIKRDLIINYLGEKLLDMNTTSIDKVLSDFSIQKDLWEKIISKSFLSKEKKKAYIELASSRFKRMGI